MQRRRATERESGPGLTDLEADQFTSLIRERSGLIIPANRRRDLERAVLERIDATSATSPATLLRRLTSGGDRVELEAFISSLTVDESHFFRHMQQFEAIERRVIPEILARRSASRRLRVWSAGCASGQEVYSLAMALDRTLPADWSAHILATDISHDSLERARAGIYGKWSFREVTPDDLRPYVTAVDERRFRVTDRIRGAVTFGYLNLVEDSYPSLITDTVAMDLIMCRNVLIYFGAETTQRVVSRFHDSLADGGWLCVSPSELSSSTFAAFEARSFGDTTIYRKTPFGESMLRTADPRPATTVVPPATNIQGRPRPDLTPPARVPPAAPTGPPLTAWPAPRSGPTEHAGRGATAGPAEAAERRERALELMRSGLPEEAEPALAALAAGGDAVAATALARLMVESQRWDEARLCVDRATQESPMHAPAHYLSGLLYQESGDLDAALAAFRSAVYADPTMVLAQFALAGLFGRRGSTARARKHLENVRSLLEGLPREDEIVDGEGLTVGRLLEIAGVQEELL